MTEKQKIINAFKNLDFERLHNLLDDNTSYMGVTKDCFLNKLQNEVNEEEDLQSYETIEEGICNSCNKGCIAYSFKAENQLSLNLFFEEKDNRVSDIYLCNDLKVDGTDADNWSFNLEFYEEEKVDFAPSLNYSIYIQKIEKAIDEFKNLEKLGIVPIDEIAYWLDKTNNLVEESNFKQFFAKKNYKEYHRIYILRNHVSCLVYNYTNADIAKIALEEYSKIDKNDEKSIINWLLDYECYSFHSFKETKNWKKTGVLIFESEIDLAVDCSDFLETFIYEEIYSKHREKIWLKYLHSTNKHNLLYDGTVATFLKNHNLYLDLLR